jgi:hypothetical protein
MADSNNKSGRINPVLDRECAKEFDGAQWKGEAYVKGESSNERKEPKRGQS